MCAQWGKTSIESETFGMLLFLGTWMDLFAPLIYDFINFTNYVSLFFYLTLIVHVYV